MNLVVPGYAREQNAWLLLNKSGARSYGGNEGYQNEISEFYSWDSTVPHYRDILVGDLVVVWDGTHSVFGASVVDSIDVEASTKTLKACPTCGRSKISERTTMQPRWKCSYRPCRSEFDIPKSTEVPVMKYRADYVAGWRALPDMSATRLKTTAKSPKSIQSIRPVNLEAFDAEWPKLRQDLSHWTPHWNTAQHGGHRRVMTRVRIGQQKFRQQLLDTYGAVCAFTGPTAPMTLEAAHLYSFAEVGSHHPHGGLLIRRDIHRLFDHHELAVRPGSWTIAVSTAIKTYEHYVHLDSKPLQTKLSKSQMDWLSLRWQYAEAHNEYLTP